MTTSVTRSKVQARSGAGTLLRNDAAEPSATNAELMGIFAHDFNTILSAMLLRMELLSQDPDLSGTAKEDLRELATETSRARFLARFLTSLGGHKRAAPAEALDLNRLIHKTLGRLGPLIGRDAAFRFEPAREAIWILGEGSSVEDLITSLCLLSPHAGLRDGEIVLQTERVQGEADERLPAGAAAGSFVCLSLTETWRKSAKADTDETQRRELALLPLKEFARQNHGWVEAEQGGRNGFILRVFLPTVESGSAAGLDHGADETSDCHETLLVVDDEVALRRVTALTLRKRGYAVLEAGSEQEALLAWEKHRGQIDLLLTDLIMPRSRTGRELAKQMRGKIPGLKVIVTSGQGISGAERALFEREDMTFLNKPYDAAEVTQLVRECLDRRVAA